MGVIQSLTSPVGGPELVSNNFGQRGGDGVVEDGGEGVVGEKMILSSGDQ